MINSTIMELLTKIYGAEQASELAKALEPMIAHHTRNPSGGEWTEKDILLITYGDQIQTHAGEGIKNLHQFAKQHLTGRVSGIHILPFYPYTSDDGFSVVDYWQVDSNLGSWEDVQNLGKDFDLMVDGVINHISAKSEWFEKFLQGDPEYQAFFICKDPTTDVSQVVRPRTSPLLTPFETAKGTQHVWTTFSADQIDINYAHPPVFLKIVELLLFYVEQGARFIRLDAIPFLWKEDDTNCMHRPQTHQMVQLWRAILDQAAPGVQLVTESNVPHHENIEYFGDGTNEAQMVYQFPLAPLLVHALNFGTSDYLNEWAKTLDPPTKQTSFFNLTASHDGIGVRPVESILGKQAFDQLVESVKTKGGLVSSRTLPDGTETPYELNITFFEAIRDAELEIEADVNHLRFLTSQAIGLALAGIPGIYFHNLFGSLNAHDGVQSTGSARSINRRKFSKVELEQILKAPQNHMTKVFGAYLALLDIRAREKAFHPNGAQRILPCGSSVFGLFRSSPNGLEKIVTLHNLTGVEQAIDLDLKDLFIAPPSEVVDLLTTNTYPLRGQRLQMTLSAYTTVWLKG